jgi:hypothetical protein
MYSKKALPVGTMFLVLVIALAVLGVGYALWAETLTIEGDVQTGEVDVAIVDASVDECVDVNGVLTCPEPVEKEDAANCWLETDGSGVEGDDGTSLLRVVARGMYPSYHCKVSFKVESLGNVPVHVWLPEATGVIPDWVATDFEGCYGGENGFVQLHQGQSTGLCTMDIHFTNETAPVESSDSINFSWTILATQWNEDPAASVCDFALSATGAEYPGLYGSTVTPVEATLSDCSTVDALKIDSTQNFQANQPEGSPAGWAGWSCLEAGYPDAIGGGTSPGDVYAQGIAEPGTPAIDGYNYPVYPNYTFPAGEEGYVVEAAGPTPPASIYVVCAP